MTSGEMVCRKYTKVDPPFKLETERADPYHFPNDKNVKDSDHYGDYRRRQAQWDPTRRPSLPCDKELGDAVPEGLVTQFVQAHRGESRKYVPQHMLNILMDDSVRPHKDSVRTLNVDLSTADLREASKTTGPRPLVRAMPEVGVQLKYPEEGHGSGGGSGGHGHGSDAGAATPSTGRRGGGESWKWCLGGRKVVDFAAEQEQSAMATLRQSQSMPTLNSGASFLHGNIGKNASTFHGVHTRRFGRENAWDGRMRGGSEAKMGFAGTFPVKEVRPG